MILRAVTVAFFSLLSTQIAGTGEPEILPLPSATPIGEPMTVIEQSVVIPHAYDSDVGRRLSARLEVASAIVRGHFRARIGHGHPATWLADSVRRKADQLQHGFIDGAPPELLVRNLFQLHDDANELMRQVSIGQLQQIQRHIPEKLQEIESARHQLSVVLGVSGS